jgi:hypothetical protein
VVAAQMMRQMVSLVFSCTDREALNLAIFLNETFILLERWRVSPCPCAARQTFLPPSKAAFIHPISEVLLWTVSSVIPRTAILIDRE